jgi:hypothetical protein
MGIPETALAAKAARVCLSLSLSLFLSFLSLSGPSKSSNIAATTTINNGIIKDELSLITVMIGIIIEEAVS